MSSAARLKELRRDVRTLKEKRAAASALAERLARVYVGELHMSEDEVRDAAAEASRLADERLHATADAAQSAVMYVEALDEARARRRLPTTRGSGGRRTPEPRTPPG